MSRSRRIGGAALLALASLAGCRVSPLTNRIAVGDEPFLVLAGEGPDGQTDLFAGHVSGGELVRFTFSRDREASPALDPTGQMVAFLRSAGPPIYLVVMNLANAAEREVELPEAAERVGWSRSGTRLFVAGPSGIWWTPAPPRRLALAAIGASDALRWEADSALAVLVGEPPFGRVVDCELGDARSTEGRDLCLDVDGHEQQTLVRGARDPFRWGGDAVAYLVGGGPAGRIEVRPLGGGRARRLEWRRPPAHPRQPSFFPGPTSAPAVR